MRYWLSAVLLLVSLLARAEAPPPTIAIIIDDLGNQGALGERLLRIPVPMTLAYLPYRPFTERQARMAPKYGKEVMLHIPMENTKGLPLGAGAITLGMSPWAVMQTLRDALRVIPNVEGVNNHMGSAYTADRKHMDWIMTELRQYPLYFVDSRTTAETEAYSAAQAAGIPALSRDVFLDNEVNTASIDAQFRRLLEIARKTGHAIAIGHPHPETVAYLEKVLPTLDAQGIAIATVKGLWLQKYNGVAMHFPVQRWPSQNQLASLPKQVSR
ncbi:divergent polysaccharide deacetylase family protein [Hahella sp. SMD15-11]|uniref:Divergent polysaccharide deacetylase family protein n=1 Tax=Thermohahella caldifontis TaxID=3142973 RepID=A0AB39UWD2_9GAMM